MGYKVTNNEIDKANKELKEKLESLGLEVYMPEDDEEENKKDNKKNNNDKK